jgi:hypothetical protein
MMAPQHIAVRLSPAAEENEALSRRHLAFGWCALLFFLTLGIGLEAMNGFKIGWYLDVSNATRRHMFKLAHAHGVLLALVNMRLR